MTRDGPLLATTGTEHLDPEERCQLESWNADGVTPERVSIHRLIQWRCHQHPQAPAVCAWDGDWTYAELWVQSRRLAARIRRFQDPSKSAIAIYSEKSRWVVIAMLAVLRLGCHFVLLDVQHPPQRLRATCEDARPVLVLCSSSTALQAAQWAPATLTVEEPSSPGMIEEEEEEEQQRSSPHDPMYIIYTSGTTGTPKGAVISHSTFATMATRVVPLARISARSRVLQFSAFAFDACLGELFFPLVAGGCVCIPSESERMNALEAFIRRQRVTWAGLTPSLARIVDPARVPGLDCLAFMGEAITAADIDRWTPHVPHLMGLYGPAECAVYVAVQPDLRAAPHPADLGVMVTTRAWVVEPGRPEILLPPGTRGELLLEGPGVGDGYLGRPELTAAAFIQRPVWRRGGPDGRFYRTGDLVYRQPGSGALQYLGRVDKQTKLRGQRIELDEVVAHASSILDPAPPTIVAEVVDLPGQPPHLAVFLAQECEESGQPPTGVLQWGSMTSLFETQVRRLQAELPRRVPAVMVPRYVWPVQHFPQTLSGKLDRRHLREAVSRLSAEQREQWEVDAAEAVGSAPGTDAKAAPSSTAERTLQRLWAEVLRLPVEAVGRHTRWGRLGGDSLRAIQLVDRAAECGLLLTVADVLQHQTLGATARCAREDVGAEPHESSPPSPFETLENERRDEVVRIVRAQYGLSGPHIEDIYPCTAMQAEDIQASVAGSYNFTMGIEFAIPEDVGPKRLAHAWDALLAAHSILRAQFVCVGPDRYVQVVVSPGVRAEGPVDGFPRGEDNVDIWGLRRPLVRLQIHRDGRRALLLLHHALYDGHSLGLIFQHLDHACRGRPVPAAPYVQFLRWLNRRDPATEQYWSSLLCPPQRWRRSLSPGRLPVSLTSDPMVTRRVTMPPPAPGSPTTIDSIARLVVTLGLASLSPSGPTPSPTSEVVFGSYSSRRGVPVRGVTQMGGPTLGMVPVRVSVDRRRSLEQHLAAIQEESTTALQHLSGASETAWMQVRSQMHPAPVLIVQPDFAAPIPSCFQPVRFWDEAEGGSGLMFVVLMDAAGSVRLDGGCHESALGRDTFERTMRLMEQAWRVIVETPETLVGEILDMDRPLAEDEMIRVGGSTAY